MEAQASRRAGKTETTAAHERLFERRGQHVYFEAPGALGLDGVYAFAKSKGLTILDVRPLAGHYVVKAVDTP